MHTSLIAGLLSHIGLKDPAKGDYLGARGARFGVFPGSALFKKQPRWVMSAELVGGVVIGFIFGWLIDRWLGTSPLGMIVFLLLGFAGGVLNVMRSAGAIKTRSLDGDRENR